MGLSLFGFAARTFSQTYILEQWTFSSILHTFAAFLVLEKKKTYHNPSKMLNIQLPCLVVGDKLGLDDHNSGEGSRNQLTVKFCVPLESVAGDFLFCVYFFT